MDQCVRIKALADIRNAMQREMNVRSALELLCGLAQVAESTVEQKDIEAGRMNEMAGYLAEIRFLLGRLRPEQCHPGVAEESRSLSARYFDLEGRVKELRNDRTGAMK
ncbi:MAG: hypothetical protein ACYC7L_03810 [Nitrospirota bacterium]